MVPPWLWLSGLPRALRLLLPVLVLAALEPPKLLAPTLWPNVFLANTCDTMPRQTGAAGDSPLAASTASILRAFASGGCVLDRAETPSSTSTCAGDELAEGPIGDATNLLCGITSWWCIGDLGSSHGGDGAMATAAAAAGAVGQRPGSAHDGTGGGLVPRFGGVHLPDASTPVLIDDMDKDSWCRAGSSSTSRPSEA